MKYPRSSALKVSYDLRPAKQIERRMLIDTLLAMSEAGFPVRECQYTGFGGIAFVDFIMMHRILGIHKLLSVEHDEEIRGRVEFNIPFKLIDVVFESMSSVIPTLDRDLPHILWLDYDSCVDRTIVADTSSAVAQLSPGSVLLVTIDVEPPDEDGSPEIWKEYFEREAHQYFGLGWDVHDFTLDNLANISVQILGNCINDGLSGRTAVRFSPLFNFRYRDGHRMATIGGIIAGEHELRLLRSCDFSEAKYVRRELMGEPYVIEVPVLTRKERFDLDSAMPCDDNWKPKKFKLEEAEIRAYREIYRFFPSYAELLLG